MAMRILASRLAQQTQANGIPLRVCTAHMSSKSPAPTSSKTPSTQSVPSTKGRKESIMSKIAHIFGGGVQPADPNADPIPADKANFPDVIEHSTGEEKLFLLAFEQGIIDPYCNLPIERKGDMGSKENPILIESFMDDRMVACACEPAQNYMKYMTIYKGEQKRCQCGWWMKCVDAPRFWEKIPKEDLLDIPFFRDMEEDGYLDEFLKTGKPKKGYPLLGQF